jgi:glycosyltransferase involved in cell wall biosynthesis
MKQFKVSIIVPVYNVSKYIEHSVISMCTQDFSDYEIILVNDGTKDNSMEIACNVINKYKIHNQIIDQKNSGLPAARNAGLKAAKGDFVCFVDSDDIVDMHYLSRLYNTAINSNQSVCFCNFEVVSETNRQGYSSNYKGESIIKREILLNNFMKRKYKIHCCSLLIEREYLINNNIFFNEDLKFGEDNNFMWRLFPRLTTIGYVHEALYKYLTRDNSIMTKQSASSFVVMSNILIDTSNELCARYPSDRKLFEFLPGRIILGSLRSYAKQSDFKNFISLILSINYENHINKLLKYPDFRVVLLSIIYIVNKHLLYLIMRKI